MHALTLTLRRIHHGWAVALTDGREVARFQGLCAKRRALRYLSDTGLFLELVNLR